MGKRGPRPLPQEVLDARGSWRAEKNKHRPRPERGAPACPSWLCPEAKSAWRSMVPLLTAAGMIAKVDRNVLTKYCQIWARWRQAELFIQKYGSSYPIKDDSGRVKCYAQFPEVGIAHKLAALLLRMEQELGMTPSARSGIQVTGVAMTPEEQEEAEKAARFFGKGPTYGIERPRRRSGA